MDLNAQTTAQTMIHGTDCGSLNDSADTQIQASGTQRSTSSELENLMNPSVDQLINQESEDGKSSEQRSSRSNKRSIEGDDSEASKRRNQLNERATNETIVKQASAGPQPTLNELIDLIKKVPKKSSAKLKNTETVYVASDEIAKIKAFLETDKVTELNLTTGVIQFPNRNYLLVSVASKPKVENLRELLGGSGLAHIISDQPPAQSTHNKKEYLILITGFGGDQRSAEIKRKLVRQNKLLNNNNFIIQRLFTKSEPYTAILNLRTRELYDDVVGQEVINIGSSALLVYRFVAARMCMQCLQFDHAEESCPYKVTWCARCGGADHAISGCPAKGKPRCRNCSLRNERWTTHMATAPNCPYRLDVLDGLAKNLIE